MKTTRMGIGWAAAAGVLLAAAAATAQEADGRLGFRRQAAERVRVELGKVREIRWLIEDMDNAIDAGDAARAAALSGQIEQIWQSVPERIRGGIEQRHPGSGERIRGVAAEGRSVQIAHASTVRNGAGEVVRQVETLGTVARQGGTVTSEKDIAVTGAGGETRNYEAERTSTREGNTVTTSGTLTQADTGKTLRTYEGSTTREGGAVTRESTVANGQGETLRTREGQTTVQGAGAGARPGMRPERGYRDDYDLFGNRRDREPRKAGAGAGSSGSGGNGGASGSGAGHGSRGGGRGGRR